MSFWKRSALFGVVLRCAVAVGGAILCVCFLLWAGPPILTGAFECPKSNVDLTFFLLGILALFRKMRMVLCLLLILLREWGEGSTSGTFRAWRRLLGLGCAPGGSSPGRISEMVDRQALYSRLLVALRIDLGLVDVTIIGCSRSFGFCSLPGAAV